MPKLTLRKANTIQASINDYIKSLNLDTTVVINQFEFIDDQIQASRNRFQANTSKRDGALNALYDIRLKVAKANAASGINDILATIALLEKQISNNNSVVSGGATDCSENSLWPSS